MHLKPLSLKTNPNIFYDSLVFGKIVEVREVALIPVFTLIGGKFYNTECAKYLQSGLEQFFGPSS